MKVSVFTTGGTIDKVYYDALSEFQVGEPVVSHILHQVNAGFACELTELFRKDSLELTGADRAAIRAAVASCDAAQVLVTHGTDTMVETGEALLGIAGKTIVLTGSLSPARFRNSDAEFNVGCAIGALQCLPEGVYVAMNGRVFPVGHVRKNREMNRFEET